MFYSWIVQIGGFCSCAVILLLPLSRTTAFDLFPSTLRFTRQRTITTATVFRATNTPSPSNADQHLPSRKWKRPQKKPRFTQQVHAKDDRQNRQTTSSMPPRTTKSSNPMLRSDKSIEDLESILVKRWGTGLSKWTASDAEISGERRSQQPADPFAKPKKRVHRQEFYDEDDEGFEPLNQRESRYNGEEKEGRGSSASSLRLNHLFSPKPAVPTKSHKDRARSDDEIDDDKNFFFQRPKRVADSSAEKAKKPSKPKKKEQSSTAASSSPWNRLLDESGQPVYLTLDQAKEDFEGGFDAEEYEDMVSSSQPKSWQDLGITSTILLENLSDMDCGTPLAVQEKACPAIVTGNDVLVGTYTGSGKTLAFMVPLIQQILFHPGPQRMVLVVAPGRELASQIVSVSRSLLDGTGLTAMLAIGGTTFSRNLQQIRKTKPSILVGTPGRIAELVVGRPGEKGGRLKTASLQSVVLDEFDALLEYKPHRDPTRAIMKTLKRRQGDALQTIMCSATASDMLQDSNKLDNFLRPGFAQAMTDSDDILVTDAATRVSRTVIHGVVHLEHRRLALDSIRRILHTEPLPQQILIFAENARRVDIVVEKLEEMGIIAAPLRGGAGSEKMDRAEVSKALREGYVGIVVATELAARGLDAPLLTHVINLDLPTDASHYAHRAGRCGRGGRPGVVINITTSPKERNVPQRFAEKLGIKMHTVVPHAGKLCIVDPAESRDQ